MDDKNAINIQMRSEGPVDTFTIVNAILPDGFLTTNQTSYFITGLKDGDTYTFQVVGPQWPFDIL